MEQIRFIEESHEYFLGEKKLISVTQLMRKHELAPDYSNVPTNILENKASRGTLIHKEIEDYNKENEIGFTQELSQYIDLLTNEQLEVIESEKLVHNDIVAGTIDLVLKKLDQLIISDIKTTSTLHYDSVSWQLSIYLYLYDKEHYDSYIGKVIHFSKENMDYKSITLKPIEEIEKLMECERNGETYKFDKLNYQVQQIEEVEIYIATMQKQLEAFEDKAKVMRQELLKAMLENGVKSYESDNLKLTIRLGGTRESFDSTKFKSEHPEEYKNYIKTTTTKDSLIIKVKEKKEDAINN